MNEVVKFCKNITLLYVSKDLKDVDLEYFKELFADVVFVNDYNTALKKFDDFLIDIVLIDIEIDNEEGFSFIKKLKNRNSRIITMIYTRNEEKNNFLKAISFGVNGYFLKPLDKNEFLNTFGKFCSNGKN